MERVDRLIVKAKSRLERPLAPWERAMQSNPYIGCRRDELMEALSEQRDDWRQIVQVLVWKGGG